MIILFFSDLHIHHTHRFSHITSDGKTVRELEHLMCGTKVAQLIEEYNVDRVVFGGDLFGPVGDNLSTQCLDTACDFVKTIVSACKQRNIQFDMLVGNHDISGHLNNQYSHKLCAFQCWESVNVYADPTVVDNFVYMPYCTQDAYAENFLDNIKDKENKIIFSHLELKNIYLGNGILSQKGVDVNKLDEFKITLQGHYHNGGKYGKKVYVSGSTQRLSFKDQGIARNNILIYDTDKNKVMRESFDCPDWLIFTDDNIEDILKVSSNNYVRVEVSMDMLLTDEIKAKIETFLGADVHVDVNRISVNKKIDNESDYQAESEIDVIKSFIRRSDNDEQQKEALLQEGMSLIKKFQ